MDLAIIFGKMDQYIKAIGNIINFKELAHLEIKIFLIKANGKKIKKMVKEY